MAKLARKFQVRVVRDRKVTRDIYERNPERKKDERATPFIVKQVEVTIPESFMVFFPAGHSVWFETREAMVRAGVVENENFVIDLDTGEVAEQQPMLDLEALVARNTRNSAQQVGV